MAMLSSIRNKILVFAILATLVPSLGLGLLSFRQNETLINDNVGRALRALASYASRELDLWINERVHDLRALSTSNAVIDGLSAAVRHRSATNPQVLALYLHSVQEKLDPLLELTVVDAGGQGRSQAPTPARSRTRLGGWIGAAASADT